MRAATIDKILLGVAATAVLVSSVGFGWRDFVLGRGRQVSGGRVRSTAIRYVPVRDGSVPQEPGRWTSPAAQPRGSNWIYEVFAPPEIYYDARANRFAVAAPGEAVAVDQADEPVGLELVAVKPQLFPLQLVGYVGGEGHYLGSFENRLTGEMFLAGAERQVATLNLEITDFAVQRSTDPATGSSFTNQPVAKAVVRELRSGRVTTLTSDERSYTGELLAMVAIDDDDDETVRELRQGEKLERAGQTYTLDWLQQEPPAVEIIVTSAGELPPQRRTLTPRMSRAPPSAEPQD